MEAVTRMSKLGNLDRSWLTKMSSIKGLVAQGGTKPAARLMMIKISPTSNRFLRGQMMVLKTWPMVTFDLGIEVVEMMQ